MNNDTPKIELAPVIQVIDDQALILGLQVDARTRMPLGFQVGMPVKCAIALKIAPCFVPDADGNPFPGAALYAYDTHGNAVLTASATIPCFAEFTLN